MRHCFRTDYRRGGGADCFRAGRSGNDVSVSVRGVRTLRARRVFHAQAVLPSGMAGDSAHCRVGGAVRRGVHRNGVSHRLRCRHLVDDYYRKSGRGVGDIARHARRASRRFVLFVRRGTHSQAAEIKVNIKVLMFN